MNPPLQANVEKYTTKAVLKISGVKTLTLLGGRSASEDNSQGNIQGYGGTRTDNDLDDEIQ